MSGVNVGRLIEHHWPSLEVICSFNRSAIYGRVVVHGVGNIRSHDSIKFMLTILQLLIFIVALHDLDIDIITSSVDLLIISLLIWLLC
jgi:hypothetical protein